MTSGKIDRQSINYVKLTTVLHLNILMQIGCVAMLDSLQ